MAATAPFLILQHATCEPPACYEDELNARGHDLVRVELDLGEELPADWKRFAGIIAMGGPMGAYDSHRHPWLEPEIELIGDAVRAGLPFWGVCLGAQLLAAALGARVTAGARPEVGVLPVRLTPEASEDVVFSVAPPEFRTLQWHSDTYELPVGAVRLARSETYPQQAFRANNAYGIQFHLEVPADLVADWGELPAYEESLEVALGPDAMPALIRDVAAAAEEAIPLGRTLFGRWLEEIVGAGTPAGPFHN